MANQKYEAFLHIAETGSFKQAAHDLGYTQAGISYLISSMERELGIPLFVRDYGGAHLTSEGAELLPWIRNICNDERQLAGRIAELKHLESGMVRVAAFTSVFHPVVPRHCQNVFGEASRHRFAIGVP